jgi:heme-degrading protein
MQTNEADASPRTPYLRRETIVQVRGDNTGPHTMENSMRKAYMARTFRIPSGDMEGRVKDNPTLSLIHLTNVIANRGALPLPPAGRRKGSPALSLQIRFILSVFSKPKRTKSTGCTARAT